MSGLAEPGAMALEQLKGVGFEKASCHFVKKDKLELNAENNTTNLLRNVFDYDLTLTGIIDHKKGQAKINNIDHESIAAAAKEAHDNAKASPPDPAYDITSNHEGRYESGPQTADRNQMFDLNQEFLERAGSKYPHALLNVHFDHTLSDHVYLNSHGAHLHSTMGGYTFSLSLSSKKGSVTSSFNYSGVRLKELGQPLLSLGSIETSIRQNQEQIDTRSFAGKFQGDVIIAPDCSTFLAFLCQEIGDTSLIAGTSIYREKLGKKIGADALSIHSQPLSERLAGGYFITGDGFRSENATLVDKGVLKTFLLSDYGARKTGLTRAVNRGGSLIVEPGQTPYAQMISDTKEGILLCRFAGGRPDKNGDFSGVAKNSYYIKEGKIQYPLTETMVSGNIADMFQNLSAISQEQTDFGGELLPYLKVGNITISGK